MLDNLARPIKEINRPQLTYMLTEQSLKSREFGIDRLDLQYEISVLFPGRDAHFVDAPDAKLAGTVRTNGLVPFSWHTCPQLKISHSLCEIWIATQM